MIFMIAFKGKKIILTIITVFLMTVVWIASAMVMNAGYGWNEKIWWVNFSQVDYDPISREFLGIASYNDGKWTSWLGLSNGEIDCTKQNGTSLALTLWNTLDANGNYPILGQCFSEQIGWVIANADDNPNNWAAVKPNWDLTWNFWSDTIWWINVSSTDIWQDNVQKWALKAMAEFWVDSSDNENSWWNVPKVLINWSIVNNTTVDFVVGTWSTADNQDYSITGTLTIPAGNYDGTLATAISIPLIISQDANPEPDETIELSLSNPTGDIVFEDVNSDLSIDLTQTYTIINDDLPTFDKVNFVSNNTNASYAKAWDKITISLFINPADTWRIWNDLDFTIWTGWVKNSWNFSKSETVPKFSRNRTYTVQAWDNGTIKVTGINFYDFLNLALTWATLPYTPTTNVIVDTVLPVITLNGDNPQTVLKNTNFSDPWATWVDNIDWTWIIASAGSWSIDIANTWTYSLEYLKSDTAWNTWSLIRTVEVVLWDIPTLSLNWDTTVNQEVKIAYTDSWATFTDTEDGNWSVTASWTVDINSLWSYTLTYDFTDAQWNTATQITRTVNVVDTTAAVITLNGDNPQTVEQNTTFTDLLATWTDNLDGTWTIASASSWSVDTSILWAYNLVYTHTDNAWNVVSTTRIVNVVDTTLPTWLTLNLPTNFNPLTGTWEAGSTVIIKDSNGTVVATGTVDNTWNFSTTIDPVPTNLPLDIEVKDSSWNIITQTWIIASWNADTTLPVVPSIDTDTNGSPLIGTAEAWTTITVIDWNWTIIWTWVVDNNGNYSIDLNPVPNDWNITIKSEDAAWNISQKVVNVSNDLAPVIKTTASVWTWTITEDSASIWWETNKPTSSEIVYWLTISTDKTTGEKDVNPRVTSHNLTLTWLASCTKYYYKTISKDVAWNKTIDWIYNFTTTGCAWNSEVIDTEESPVVLNSSWAIEMPLSIGSWNSRLEVEVPIWYNATNTCAGWWAYFQLKELNKNPIISSLWLPSGKTKTLRTYDLSAYCTATEKLHNFDKALKVKINYSDADIAWLDENALKIYRYNTDSNSWKVLNNCLVDAENNTISCDTNHFSTFGIFTNTSSSIAWWEWTSRHWGYSNKKIWNLEKNSIKTNNSNKNIEINTKESDKERVDQGNKEHIKRITNINWEEKVYYLHNEYNSCETIDRLLDKNYTSNFISELKDISYSLQKNNIIHLEKAGVISGTKENNFEWKRSISRVEFLKIILRSHCLEYRKEDASDLDFIDLDNTSWKAKVIKKSIDLWIAVWDRDKKWNKVFRANDVISHIEATKILLRMALVQNGEEPDSKYKDIQIEWHKKYVEQWEYLWIFNAEDDSYIFSPNLWIDRDKTIEFIYRVIKLYR